MKRFWNDAEQGVREYYLRNLRDAAKRYDFDNTELDFAVVLSYSPGETWRNRHQVTNFVRQLRQMLLEVKRRRDHPFLLSARVPSGF